MIDIENNTIEFELRKAIGVSIDGQVEQRTDLRFNQPNRKTAPLFENLCNMLSTASQSLAPMMSAIGEDGIEAAKEKKAGEIIDAEAEFKGITEESIAKKVAEYKDFLKVAVFDYEKAYKKFEKMILQEARFAVCTIGGMPLRDTHLDQIDFRDFKSMLLTYISFFEEPVKSDTDRDSEPQSDSQAQAKVL